MWGQRWESTHANTKPSKRLQAEGLRFEKNDKSLFTVVVCSRKKLPRLLQVEDFKDLQTFGGSGGVVYERDVPSRRTLQARSRTGWSACVSQLTWEAFGVPQRLLPPNPDLDWHAQRTKKKTANWP